MGAREGLAAQRRLLHSIYTAVFDLLAVLVENDAFCMYGLMRAIEVDQPHTRHFCSSLICTDHFEVDGTGLCQVLC